jgi:hypothetical protein
LRKAATATASIAAAPLMLAGPAAQKVAEKAPVVNTDIQAAVNSGSGFAVQQMIAKVDPSLAVTRARLAMDAVNAKLISVQQARDLVLREARNPPVFRVYQKWVDPTNYVAVDWHGGWRGT